VRKSAAFCAINTMSQTVTTRWTFTDNDLKNHRLRKRDAIGAQEEIQYRQKGTHYIKEMADLLKLRPICMNTGIVYFHRFFALRSFKAFHVNEISICSLFLAAKFEEQPIRKEDLIRAALCCRPKTRHSAHEDFKSEYRTQCERLIANENEMLLTFGFDLMVIHSHTVIISASDNHSVIKREIGANAYKMAGDLLRLTTACLQHSHTFMACVCLYLSAEFLNTPITTKSVHNWCHLIDDSVRLEDVEVVANKYKAFLDKSKYSGASDRKRKLSYDEAYSPESAYSSGSNNSPDYNRTPPPLAPAVAPKQRPTPTPKSQTVAANGAAAPGGNRRLNMRISVGALSKRSVVIIK